MKRVFLVTLVVMLAFSMLLTACTPATNSDGTSTSQETNKQDSQASEANEQTSDVQSKVILGYTPLTMEIEYFQNTYKGMLDAMDPNLIDIIVKDPQMDSANQVTGVEDMIAAGAEVICICSIDTPAAEAAVEYAKERGVKIISQVSDFEGADVYIGLDEYNFGRICGESAGKYIAENMGGEAKIAELNADTLGEGVVNRMKGYVDAIMELNPNAEVVANATAFTEEEALTTIENMLQEHPEINFVITANDPGVYGALAAIESKGLQDQVKIHGLGSENRLCQLIIDGKVIASVDSGPDETGKIVIDVAMKLARGEEVEKNIYVNTAVIDAARAQEILDTRAKYE